MVLCDKGSMQAGQGPVKARKYRIHANTGSHPGALPCNDKELNKRKGIHSFPFA